MDIIKILEEAIASEKEDQEKYMKLAREAGDPATRAIFEQLARDEEDHQAALKERLTAVKLMKGLGMVD